MKAKKKLYISEKKRYLNKIIGSLDTPRLSVFRSNKQIYTQLVEDYSGHTLSSFSTLDIPNNIKLFCYVIKNFRSYFVGRTIAKILINLGISSIVFDRGRNPYKGRIKNLAAGLRKNSIYF